MKVRVQPRAKRTAFAGVHGEAVKVCLAAPPVDGKANSALQEFLAEFAGVAKSLVRLQKGEKSRSKTILLESISVSRMTQLLEEAGVETDASVEEKSN